MTKTSVYDASLHEAVIASFIKRQRPPTLVELAVQLRSTESEVRDGLRGLAERHGIVLQPQSDEVWIAHPFSAAPTPFVVRSADRTWWGNCAWCSLGVAHLVGGSAVIETRLGAIGEQVSLRIDNGRLLDTDFVVHFPIAMRHAWDNVIYTCSVMLLFRDEAQVDEWCARRGIPKGDVRPIEQVWRFAAEWYGRHADADWQKWSTAQAAEIFKRHHLTSSIWSLGEENERF